MKYVVRYLLEGNGTVPMFIETGGYFELNEELVGISVDEDKRHVPNTVIKMSRQDLIDRVTLIAPMKHKENELMSAEEIENMVDSFLEQHGMN